MNVTVREPSAFNNRCGGKSWAPAGCCGVPDLLLVPGPGRAGLGALPRDGPTGCCGGRGGSVPPTQAGRAAFIFPAGTSGAWTRKTFLVTLTLQALSGRWG